MSMNALFWMLSVFVAEVVVCYIAALCLAVEHFVKVVSYILAVLA